MSSMRSGTSPDPGPTLDIAYVPGTPGADWTDEEVHVTRMRILQVALGEPAKLIFSLRWDFVSTRGLTQFQLFETKTTTIQNCDFVAIWRGFPSPNQKMLPSKITKNHMKITNKKLYA